MEQKQYNLKNALSIACDIFDKQGYKKENDPAKGIETNKTILGKRLDAQPDFVHPNIEDILSFKNTLVFKKLSGKISDYEHLVIKILEKEVVKIFKKFGLSNLHALISTKALINAELVGAYGHGLSPVSYTHLTLPTKRIV